MFYGPWIGAALIKVFSWCILFVAIVVTPIEDEVVYVPKKKRSQWRRRAQALSNWLQSWLKRSFTSFELAMHEAIGPTKRRRKIYLPTKRQKKVFKKPPKMIQVYSAGQDPGNRQVNFDTDAKRIKIDNHATRSMTHDIKDVVGTFREDKKYRINGIGGAVTGYGCTIRWQIQDDHGQVHTIELPNSVYAPKTKVRILSPQHWAQVSQDKKNTWCETHHDRVTLHWGKGKFTKTTKLDKSGTNVATISTAPGYEEYKAFIAEADLGDELVCYDTNVISDDEQSHADTTVSDDQENDDISENEQRQGPLTTDFKGVIPEEPVHVIEDEEDSQYQDVSREFLMWHHRLGHTSPKKIREMARQERLPKRLAKCQIPLCTSCLYGKATKRPWRSKTPNNKDESETITHPGECVSVDQIESFNPGLIAQVKGIPTKERYTCATVFVDHYSGFGYVHCQRSTDADETIQAKEAFERFAWRHGVRIEHYHADNGRFAEHKWMNHVKERQQTISFSGVGAHFQNAVAERRIRDLQENARAMLIHAKNRWFSAIEVHLWPYALRMANDISNCTWDLPREKIPIEGFTGTSQTGRELKHWIPFGAPVYVLDSAIQDGKKINKWKNRSRVAIYLGRSPNHTRTVGLCLSLTTGLVSPQFHFTPDSKFQTMRRSFGNDQPESKWQAKCHFVKKDVRFPSTRSKEATSQREPREAASEIGSIPEGAQEVTQENERQDHTTDEPETPPLQANGEPARRSDRNRRAPGWLLESHVYAADITNDGVPYQAIRELEDVDELDMFAASTNPDIMYYHEAMREDDKPQFIEAMIKEVNDQSGNDNWELTHINDVPEGAQIVPGVWAMRRKRRIKTNEIYKWKARINVDGSKQIKGVSYWETYSPVVSWPIVRLLLALVCLLNWHTVQIDYVQAYPQAPAESEKLYMKVPKGFEITGVEDPENYVLKVKRNIYGQKQAGRVWNKYLVKHLEEIGFKQSKIDDCVFYRGKVLLVLYVDDSILAGPDKAEINEVIELLKQSKLNITIEGDLADFLGVNIDRKDDGTIHLTQPQLIESILQDLRITGEHVSVKNTPAKVKTLLRRHEDSEPFDNSFNYRSVIGKLNYLEKSTRPDIAYAVHQCARFSHDPKKEHGQAVRWIGRYLAGTKHQGIIYKPNDTSFECYVDADFMGNWDPEGELLKDPDTARSRSGYVAMLAGCPIFWASKLQSTVALSSSESEFVALSTALRDIIPVMNLLKEMKNNQGWDVPGTKPKIQCRVFEDNSGALEMAVNEKFRPRTKHINGKYHHFRSYVENGDIEVKPIKTDNQPADYTTKSLAADVHNQHRYFVQGW